MKQLLLAAALILLPTNKAWPDAGRIGIIAPLSGEVAYSGEACRHGAELAQEGLPSEDRKSLEVVFEDDGNDPKRTLSAFRMLTEKGATTIVSMFSGTSKAIAPIAEKTGVTLVAIASDNEIWTGKKFVFGFWVKPEEEVRVLIPELKRRGITRIARISSVHTGIKALKREFDRQRADQFVMVMDEDYGLDDKDFKAYLAKLRRAGPIDAIFINLYFGQVGLFARQAGEMGITVPLFSIETFEDKNEVAASGGRLLNQIYAQGDDGDPAFLAALHQRWPASSTYTAANCHDAVLLLNAARRAGIPPANYLHSVRDFHGALGTYSATEDNNFTLPAVVKRVTEQGFEKLVINDNRAHRDLGS